MSDVTQILQSIDDGDPHAVDRLLPLVYEELRRVADARMASEASDHTLQATALVHEAYLRLVDVPQPQCWNGRAHFFRAASEAMRRILVEQARRRTRIKHGGHLQQVELSDDLAGNTLPSEQMLALDEALSLFAKVDPNAAELVKLRFFVGLTLEEAAQTLGISERNAYRDWTYARAWLFHQLREGARSSPE